MLNVTLKIWNSNYAFLASKAACYFSWFNKLSMNIQWTTPLKRVAKGTPLNRDKGAFFGDVSIRWCALSRMYLLFDKRTFERQIHTILWSVNKEHS